MKLLRNLLLSCITLTFSNIYATHLVSMEGYVECIGTNGNEKEYSVNITHLRDAIASPVEFDQAIDVGVYGKNDGLLKTVIQLPRINEQVVYKDAFGFNFLIEGHFKKTITLPNITGGYVIQFRRCCLPASVNFINDQGAELLIHIPESMQTGQHTFKWNAKYTPLFQKNINYTLDYPWSQNLCDSTRFESNDFYEGGTQSDPLPSIPAVISYGQPVLFQNGASAGNPFGSAGTFVKNSDSTYQIQINQSGYFLYPITSSCYLNGDSFKYTVMFPAITMDTVVPLVHLELNTVTENKVILSSMIQNWSNTSSVTLLRMEQGNPNPPVTVKSNLLINQPELHTDSLINLGKTYEYFIHLISNGISYYSDTISAKTWMVNLASPVPVQKIQIYPNPAAQQIHVVSPVETDYQLYSVSGQFMMKGILYEGANTLNIDQLKPGIYLLKTESETLKLLVHPQP